MMTVKNEAGEECYLFFVNKKTQKRYQVVKLDNESMTLKGAHEPFTEPYNRQWLIDQGYRPEKVPVAS